MAPRRRVFHPPPLVSLCGSNGLSILGKHAQMLRKHRRPRETADLLFIPDHTEPLWRRSAHDGPAEPEASQWNTQSCPSSWMKLVSVKYLFFIYVLEEDFLCLLCVGQSSKYPDQHLQTQSVQQTQPSFAFILTETSCCVDLLRFSVTLTSQRSFNVLLLLPCLLFSIRSIQGWTSSSQ